MYKRQARHCVHLLGWPALVPKEYRKLAEMATTRKYSTKDHDQKNQENKNMKLALWKIKYIVMDTSVWLQCAIIVCTHYKILPKEFYL